MRISRLITLHWGTIEDRDWPLADATLLTGESGSGKSTLLDAIQAVLTAARSGVFHFNAGQNESTQSRRGGKEPRTLHSYALGQSGSDVFLRRRATCYVGLVIEASVAAGETAEPFTAVMGVEAHEEAGRAEGGKPLFFIVRQALSLQHFVQTQAEAGRPRALGLRDLYVQLQHRLSLAADQVQRFEGKDSYLQHLYGAMLGKRFVPEVDATRCAKALVKAMAYKEIGNVNDLVRDEILEEKDFSADVGKMRQLMQEIARLKAEAERLKLNIDRLKLVDEAASDTLALLRRHVVTLAAQALRLQQEGLAEQQAAQRREGQLRAQATQSNQRLARIQIDQQQLQEELARVQGQLAQSDVAQEKQRLSLAALQSAELFRKEWNAVCSAATQMDEVLGHVQQLLALDLSQLPALQTAVQAMAPVARQAHKLWGPARQPLMAEARLDDDLAAFEIEPLDQALRALEQALCGEQGLVSSVLIEARSTLHGHLAALKDEQVALQSEQALLQAGRSPAPADVQAALNLLETELPRSRPRLLAALVEPKRGSPWQAAIEGYMGRDRFALIVEPEAEEAAIKLIKRRFAQRSPKLVQGSRALDDTKGRAPDAGSVLGELECHHPVAWAYLLALYGRVRKVDSEAELRRTPQGLMQQGLGSRAYGMFACLAAEHDLTFGLESRQRRLAWISARLDALAPELVRLHQLDLSLKLVAGWFSRVAAAPLAKALEEALATRLKHLDVATALARLDTSSIDALEQNKAHLDQRLQACARLRDGEMQAVGVQNNELKRLQHTLAELQQRLPTLAINLSQAQVWLTRYVNATNGQATELQLQEEARQLGLASEPSSTALRSRIDSTAELLRTHLQTLRNHVGTYLAGARSDDERFQWTEPPRVLEQMEAVLGSLLQVQQAVREQTRRQDGIGLAENLAKLEEAERRFNTVFTSSFCFKVRDDVRSGLNTLRKLNNELKTIQFGVDGYELVHDWQPRFKRYFDFFEALDSVVDQLEKERVAIFDAPQLSAEHRETAQDIKQLLLSQDQIASERALKELADYRNYRRYDIHRIVAGHRTPMSTWGTGSGGELETPFYVIRAAVLAHALGHFGRTQGAPALRLMLSDEAFSKMDESRSRAVLRFLSVNMGLQLIVAMPTSKSGAIKPEFDKEYTFSKLAAEHEGQTVYCSEVHEKDLHREALGRLWEEHARHARAQARADFELNQGPAS